MTSQNKNKSVATTKLAITSIASLAACALLFLSIFIGSPDLIDNDTNQSWFNSPRELVVSYSRLTKEEVTGVGIYQDYKDVAAVVFQGLPVTPSDYTITPLYKELVGEMQTKNVSENMALLSLIGNFNNSSERFLKSNFYTDLQNRLSSYGFARNFVVRFNSERQDLPQLINQIERKKAFFRANNLLVRVSPVRLSQVVGIQKDPEALTSAALPGAIPACSNLGRIKVAVIGDEFYTRSDQPQVTRIGLTQGNEAGCGVSSPDNAYDSSSKSYGTNLIGVIANICPSCDILGFDVGCSAKGGKGYLRASEGAQGFLSAILRGAHVVLLTTADSKPDPIYSELIKASVNAGVVVVAAAGDNSENWFRYPAAYKSVIGVGALNRDGTRYELSNYGAWVVATALGAGVVTVEGVDSFIKGSSTALAAARVAAGIGRYLLLNPGDNLASIAVLAASGALSNPSADECAVAGGGAGSGGTGDSGAGGGSGSGTGGGSGSGDGSSSGGSGSSSGSGSGAGSGSSSGSGSSGGSGAGSSGGSGSGSSGAGSESGSGLGAAASRHPLNSLSLPSTITAQSAGLSPFATTQFITSLKTQEQNTGVASADKDNVSTASTTENQVAEVVYTQGSQLQNFLTKYERVTIPDAPVDVEDKQLVARITVPQATNLLDELLPFKDRGLVGAYLTLADNSSVRIASTLAPQPSSSSGVVTTQSSPSPLPANEATLSEMNYNTGVREFTSSFKTRVKLAIISTGLDYEAPAFKDSVTSNLLVTSSYRDLNGDLIQGDFPTDIDNFGTQVAGILSHSELGIAKDFVELIPIKVAVNPLRLSLSDLIRGIALAVNKGAEIILLPHFFNTEGCHPVLGHAMYKAREKGVTFITGAGDGLRNRAGDSVGYPVVAASDDGPASYETTSNPACWSNYFLGAVSFASSEGFAKPLSAFSNYGDDIEMSARGVGIDTVGLNNAPRKAQGTAFSAAFGAAAAAMVIAHHKSLQFKYGPWYVENLIVESAKRDPNALSYINRNRFGSFLDFEALAQLLVRTESMTEEERRNSIPTINPRQGAGWKPGEDKANLRYVALSLSRLTLRPGEELTYRVVAYFRDGSERDVTRDAAATRLSIQVLQGKRYLELVEVGRLRVLPKEAFANFKGDPVFTVTANYSHEQAQGFDSAAVRVDLEETERELTELRIIPPGTPVRAGQDINLFRVEGKYSDNTRENVTGGATWTTSAPNELAVRATPGVLDARRAVAGRSYTVTASFGGKTASMIVTVVGETLKSFYVHNYLGQAAKVERGQRVVLESRMILTANGVDRERAMNATWYQGTSVLNSGAGSRSITIDTTYMTPGRYTYRAVSIFKSEGVADREVSATIEFEVENDVARIEIHLKTAIVQLGQAWFIDLRAYRNNNSYVVVTEDATWSTSEPRFASINRHGVGYVSEDFLGSQVTLYAEYKGKRAQINLSTLRGSVVTGSSSALDYITLQVNISQQLDRYCYFPSVTARGFYKDGSMRVLNVASVSFAEQRADGTWGEASRPLYGGRIYRASVTYNDGSTASGGGGNAVASVVFTMPKQKLDGIDFGVNGRTPVIFRNAQSQTGFLGRGICELISSNSDPVGIRTRVLSAVLSIFPDSTGRYTVSAQAYYTGMGVRELKEGSFQVDIRDAVPTTINIAEAMSPINKSAYSPYGTRSVEVTLEDADKRRLYFEQRDLELKFFQGDREVNLSSDPRLKMVWQSNSGTNLQHQFLLHLYPQSLGQSYSLRITHKPTGFSSARAFTDVGSWEASDAIPWDLPSTELPIKNTQIHPACQEFFKNPSDLEFAGGEGSDADPLIICSTGQLKKLDGLFIGSSKYCTARSSAKAPCKTDKSQRYVLRLGAGIDFKGEVIKPIVVRSSSILDGAMFAISNYVIVDSEQNRQALFGFPGFLEEFRDLIIENPIVRGSTFVAALSAMSGVSARNLTVVGGSIWGQAYVYGVGWGLTNSRNVRVIGTEVRYEQSHVGGLARELYGDNQQLLFAGRIAPAGVPGYGRMIAGIAPTIRGTASNILMTGDVISLNSNFGDTSVGGIVSHNSGLIINAEMRGNIVSTGSGVGGIAGSNLGNDPWSRSFSSFGLDPLKPNPSGESLFRKSGIIRAKVSGNIWGGMSRKTLFCIDKVSKILGVGGGTECIGDIKSQTGGQSYVGGIAGLNYGLIQDSEFTGTVRAVNGVGGIVGFSKGEQSDTMGLPNYVRNRSAGTVSASESAKDYGALIGRADFLAGTIQPRLDSNVITPGEGNPTWAIGNLNGKEYQSNLTSNVPAYYDRY